MFKIGYKDRPRPKCYFTHSILPAFVDHDQPSQKKRPFSTIQAYPYIHTLELLLPKDACKIFEDKLKDKGTPHYAKVYMKLSDLIEGDYFNDYIKTGNILMLSEGRPGSDNIFSLREGILRLEVDKATYERMGLNGTAVPYEGRKHVKTRYAVEMNLRLPSMVRGKDGFERIVWAFKNVLNSRVAWLFCDLEGSNDGTGPIAAHQPILRKIEPKFEELGEVKMPHLPDEIEANDQETPSELLEWLSLTVSGSERVRKDDQIDPYLSRYQIVGTNTDEAELLSSSLGMVSWHGFLPPSFVQTIVIAALKSCGDGWFALATRAFGGKTHTFLQHNQHTWTWEYED